MLSKKFFTTTILTLIPLCATHIALSVFSIEPFNRHRDQDAVEKILSHDAKVVAYCPIRFAIELSDPKHNTDVIRTNDTVIGVIQYFTDKDYDWSLDYKKFGYIRLLAIDQAYRKKGYGKLLLDHAVSNMEQSKVSYIYLIVSKKNSVAKQLYQSAEFSSNQKQVPFFAPGSFIPDLWFIPGCEQKKLLYYKNYESTGERRAEINQKKCVFFTLAIGVSMLMTYFGYINLVNNS